MLREFDLRDIVPSWFAFTPEEVMSAADPIAAEPEDESPEWNVETEPFDVVTEP